MKVSDLFERHKLVRRLALLWAVLLVTYIVIKILDPVLFGMITAAHATVVVAFVGILTTVVGLYQWLRSQD